MRQLRDRLDPQLDRSLRRLFELTSPRGFQGFADLDVRRARYREVMSGVAPDPWAEQVERSDDVVPGSPGHPDVRVRIYRPANVDAHLPGVFFIHGGGMVMGDLDSEDPTAAMLTAAVGCALVSVDYRLAPENPHPAPVEDCYAGLSWMFENSGALGIDSSRIAVYGSSAGGGLAAAVTLLARDRGGPRPAYQMLIYPMIDDRNRTPSSRTVLDLGMWDRDANLEGWRALLGDRAGGRGVSPYAAPGRAEDLHGLPPAFVEVGDLDLFLDEDLTYARRLLWAGVPVEMHVYAGACHGFDLVAPRSRIARRAVSTRVAALRTALNAIGGVDPAPAVV